MELTDDPAKRAVRALAAAQASLGSGAFDRASELLVAADAGPLDELGRARIDLIRAEIVFAQTRGPNAPRLLLQAARKLEPLDVRLSRNTYLDAWGAALFAGHLADAGGSLQDVSVAAATASAPAGGPLPRDVLLDGLALMFTEGTRAAEPVLRRAITAFGTGEASVEEVLRWGWLAARAATWLWDYDSGFDIPERAVKIARNAGALEVLAVVTTLRAGRGMGRRFRARRPAGGRGRGRQGGDGQPDRPVRRDLARRGSAAGSPRPSS